MMKHIVFNSGGIASYITAKRVINQHGPKNTIHLFTDTLQEDTDLYRFLKESVCFLGGELVHLIEGRDIWQVFNDVKLIGNTRVDPCSKILKRDIGRAWLYDNFKPNKCRIYFGISHDEKYRFKGTAKNNWQGIEYLWLPYRAVAPLIGEKISRTDMLKECERDGIDPPRLYDEGFPHNNCGGFCVKAGVSHFHFLYKTRPDTFMYHALKEQEFREKFNKDVTILTRTRDKKKIPLSLLQLKHEIDTGKEIERNDWGKSCQCFFPDSNKD